MKTPKIKLSLFALIVLAAVALPIIFQHPDVARAADHRDAPGISEDGRADILDVYAFLNPNNGNVVLAMTVNPFVIGGAPQVAFSPDVLYEFKIDNTGDFKEDLVIQGTFTPTVPGPQMVTVTSRETAKAQKNSGKIKSQKRGRPFSLTGVANGSVTNSSDGVTLFAGLRDDPFFLDLIWVFRLLGIQPGGPLTRSPGIDFFSALNASVLAVEVPPSFLQGSSGNTIRVWATTSRAKLTLRARKVGDNNKDSGGFVQVDRMGLPVINTVLIPSPLKDAFNRAQPTQDQALFRDTAISTLVKINGDAAYSAVIADLLLPDVLTVDLKSNQGFLNGRRPQDDVVDAVLSAASKNTVTTDNVNANDVPFLSDFPFFAPPHPPQKPIPGRN